MKDTKIEYRVKKIERWIVTRHEESMDGKTGKQTVQIGSEYANAEMAYEVGYACCKQEALRLGYGPDDMRIIYPSNPALEKCGLTDTRRGLSGKDALD